MFKSTTTFVVGAGASKEADLPVGYELTKRIAGLVQLNVELGNLQSGDYQIYKALMKLSSSGPPWDQNQFLGSGREIAEAMQLAPSIDTFLETHATNQEFIMLGKLGIARAIADEERKSKLATSDNSKPLELSRIAGTWYQSLAQQLFTGVPVETPEAAFQGVSFIVFNYDRCLQTFLVRAMEVYFRLNRQQAEAIVSKVPIVHAYGTLGSIFQGSSGHVAYGSEELDLVEAASRIKTFSESVDSETSQTIRALVSKAETLIFLGFGFHDQNMALLNPAVESEIDGSSRYRVFATTKGLSQSDEQVVRDQISILLTGAPEDVPGQWIHTNNGTCSELFGAYWRSLTDAARLSFNNVI